MIRHESVLLREAVEGLNIKEDGIYVDATFGAGGHSKAIFEKLDSRGRLIAFDQDVDVDAGPDWGEQFTLIQANFRYLGHFLDYLGIESVDGVLADLGVSSHHLDTPERGFSFRYDAPLDMRMRKSAELTAREVVNEYGQQELLGIMSRYGEVRNSKTLVRHLIEEREQKPIETTLDLVGRIEPVIRGHRERYLAQVFQAIRIEVNDELGALKDFLKSAREALRPGSRLAVITFHSLEDRIVKKEMKARQEVSAAKKKLYGPGKPIYKVITNKAITASDAELERNPRSRSAQLRIAEKI
ncbi:MAG: 16S rRNA (cytosine(1402)-N(4))-methyltransferase RsmH [Saprospiraceae bacterium]|nr:16S rRNA (cytosine(1402)-N(4))-methyltransferase RsmH [Saprospiraceae bacterium]